MTQNKHPLSEKSLQTGVAWCEMDKRRGRETQSVCGASAPLAVGRCGGGSGAVCEGCVGGVGARDCSAAPMDFPRLCLSETNPDHITEPETWMLEWETPREDYYYSSNGRHIYDKQAHTRMQIITHISTDAQFTEMHLITSLREPPVPAVAASVFFCLAN